MKILCCKQILSQNLQNFATLLICIEQQLQRISKNESSKCRTFSTSIWYTKLYLIHIYETYRVRLNLY